MKHINEYQEEINKIEELQKKEYKVQHALIINLINKLIDEIKENESIDEEAAGYALNKCKDILSHYEHSKTYGFIKVGNEWPG